VALKAFVTGGSGFVGRNLIAALRGAQHEVVALARSPAAAAAVEAAGAAPVSGDLTDTGILAAAMNGCALVFHAAAHVEEWGPESLFEQVNVVGTENVLAAARKAGVRRVIHVSTESVLADGAPIIAATEARPYPGAWAGPYPRTKARAEKLLLEASQADLETVAVRPRFVWGAGDTTLLPKLLHLVASGRWMWIEGGRYPTSTCHVRNLCQGLLDAAARGTPGQAYFVTDGPPLEFRSFVTRILETQGVTAPDKSLPRWVARAAARACERAWRTLRLSGMPPVTRTAVALVGQEVTVSDEKARRELGYAPVVTLEEGLREMRDLASGAAAAAASAPRGAMAH
jgi:nucleoside-diphosphate-sugar epimerase